MILHLVCRLLASLVGLLYPIYASHQAIEAAAPRRLARSSIEDKAKRETDLEGWCIYWMVVGSLSLAEGFMGWFLWYLPFYSLLRLVFILWLAVPQTKGSTYLYTSFLAPFLAEHQAEIDALLQSAKSSLGQALTSLVSTAGGHFADLFWALVSSGHEQDQGSAAVSAQQRSRLHGAPFPVQRAGYAVGGDGRVTDPSDLTTSLAASFWRKVSPILAIGAQTAATRAQALQSSEKEAAMSAAAAAQGDPFRFLAPLPRSKEERSRQRAALQAQLAALESSSDSQEISSDDGGSGFVTIHRTESGLSGSGSRTGSPSRSPKRGNSPLPSPLGPPPSKSFSWLLGGGAGAAGLGTPPSPQLKKRSK